jgi:hypothetical protein
LVVCSVQSLDLEGVIAAVVLASSALALALFLRLEASS